MSNNIVSSCVRPLGGVPALFVDGKPFTAAAYMTYLEKFNEYDDFVKAGYNFFSVPVLFAGRWISATEGFKPFKKGIFDEKGKPDFTPYDEAINRILDICPGAYIIPRVNICMPLWWEKENPDGVNIMPGGKTLRESFYSEKWLNDAGKMLREFVAYSENAPYASHIIGYHIAGGNTEEWFHFDLNGGCCKNAEKGFAKYLYAHFPDMDYTGLPDLGKLHGKEIMHGDAYLAAFLEYASVAVADAICDFARAVKDECKGRVVVGAFYGYSLEVTSPLHGTHALEKLLNCESIDFISSPNSYIGIRDFACDWSEMYPADSVRLHGKMCFQECDIRTHLTVLLSEKDPETDPLKNLSFSIWLGPDTKEKSVGFMRKSFCRQLVKGNGFWWFDMWGGWYADSDLMKEMSAFRSVYENGLACENRGSVAETAAFIDESAYKLMTDCAARNVNFDLRKNLGCAGIAFDVYDLFDFERVYEKYDAVVFLSAAKTERMENALKICREKGLPYLLPDTEKMIFSPEEIRDFCRNNGVKVYTDNNDIIYINHNFAALCALSDGEKKIRLSGRHMIKDLFSGEASSFDTDEITVYMKKGEVRLFGID